MDWFLYDNDLRHERVNTYVSMNPFAFELPGFHKSCHKNFHGISE